MPVLSRRTATPKPRRDNRQSLIDAVLELLDEGAPFADISIEQIVRAAGLSRPTFYTYFRDKRELVLHLGEALERDLAATADPWLNLAEDSILDTLTGVLDVFRRHAATVGAIVEAACYDPEVAVFWQRFHDRFAPGAAQRVRAGFPDLDDAAVAARAFALVHLTEAALVEHVARATVDEAALLEQLAWMWQAATAA